MDINYFWLTYSRNLTNRPTKTITNYTHCNIDIYGVWRIDFGDHLYPIVLTLMVTNQRSWKAKSMKKQKWTKWIPRGNNNRMRLILRTLGAHISNPPFLSGNAFPLLEKFKVDKIFVTCLVCYRFWYLPKQKKTQIFLDQHN